MNRNELIDYIRDPASLTSENLNQLEEIVAEAPYFQSARMLLAKGSAILTEPATKKRVSSAAIYATDRPLLKKYISGNLLFLTKPPSPEVDKQETSSQTGGKDTSKQVDPSGGKGSSDGKKQEKDASALTTQAPTDDKLFIPGIPVGALDAMLEELEQDMEDLKSSRSKFADMQDHLDDDEPAEVVAESEVKEATSPVVENESSGSNEVLANEPKDEKSIKEPESVVIEPDASEKNVEEKEVENLEASLSGFEQEVEEIEQQNIESPSEIDDSIVESKDLESQEDLQPQEESEPEVVEKVSKEDTDEEDEIEKAITEKLKNLQKQESPKVEEEEPEQPKDESEAEPEPPLANDHLTEIKIESDIRREQRMEKRLQREKRLSSLNELSESSIKKLEDQMWGDSGADSKKETADVKSDSPEASSAKSEPKKTAEKKESSSKPEKELAEKSSTKKSSPEEVSKKEVEKEQTKKAPAIRTASPKKSATTVSAAKKTTTKKPAAKKVEPKKAVAKKTTITQKPTTTKAATTRKISTKGTTKKSTTKKAAPKKKDDDDGKSDRPKKQDKLIEKFISENPSISKAEKKLKTDSDLSTKSATWNKELASEYLAEIYLNQGNKKRAIEIYKVLSLNFPEKKSYFADLISKIK